MFWNYEVSYDYTLGDLSIWDRFDYLLALLGNEGIFVWSDILNSCQLRPDLVDVIDDPNTAAEWIVAVKEVLGTAEYKNMMTFYPLAWDPRSQKIYHNYIKKVLNHKNKHNGLTYAEDPTFFTWELTNEEWWIMRILWGNHLALPQFFQKQLYNKWNGMT